ncbi:cupredoxin domain-containing protein [Thermoleophilum album]|uniref:cupredoxin domain-containing protein n=1 Tax=Thermoleophilum album TaxID=29539 RepID=UPI001FDF7C0E|nr:cupredoxin family copper-binding protein [Thermoleophilum album]
MASAGVTIHNFAFSPANVTIRVGESVTWTNTDSVVHNAAGQGFRIPLLQKGRSASFTFTRPGVYRYHCEPHPFMRGTVTVLAAAASPQGSGSGATGRGRAGGGAASGGQAPRGAVGGSAGPSQPQARSGPSLPATGAAAGVLALVGAGLLGGGLGIRRSARRFE